MRLQYIEAIRGLAALGVAYYHFVQHLADTGKIGAQGFYGWVYGHLGIYCVMVFFVVSGFVIPASITDIRSFAIRRFFRLYPTYWLSLVWAALAFGTDQATLAANATMLQGLLGFKDINGVAWTLTLELVFYALCAALFATRQLGNVFVLAGIAFACFIFGENKPGPLFLPYGIAMMCCGAILRKVVPAFDLRVPVLPWLGSVSFQVYLLHLPLIRMVQIAKQYPAARWFYALPAPAMIVSFMVLVVLVAWLVHRYVEVPFINLGRRITLTPSPRLLQGRS